MLARSDIVINCNDPLVECGSLHHILTSGHRRTEALPVEEEVSLSE